MYEKNEDKGLRSVARKSARTVLLKRQQAERDLIRANAELERKTEELAYSLSLMRATLESTTDGILVTDVGGKVTGHNEKYLQMWGLSRTALTLADHRQLVADSGISRDCATHIKLLNEIYATSPLETFDLLELVDGRVFERFSKIQRVNERAVGRVWSYRDITERRHSEEELRYERHVLELLNRTGTAIASMLDSQTLVLAVTDATRELSGAPLGGFFFNPALGKNETCWCGELSGDTRSAAEEVGRSFIAPLFRSNLPGRGSLRCDDILKESAEGRTSSLANIDGLQPMRSCLAVPVISRSGEMIGGLFFAHPLAAAFHTRDERIIVAVAAQAAVAIDNARLYEAAQKAAEERENLLERERMARASAERMSELKDEFLANLSHELRTPLNAIVGWAKVLRSGVKDASDLQNGLDSIERNARVQTQLIGDLLDMNRIASGKIRLDMQAIAPVSFIEAAIETVRPAADAKGILIQKQLDPEVPITGDPNRLQQVVWNLLSNAIKFTSKGGRVQVFLVRVDSHAEITVADNGNGIRPEFLDHVFERFRQEEASTNRRFGGLGLGLSIVKHLVELHGGTVRAESPGEGCGATFRVLLPLMVSQRAAYSDQRVKAAGAEPASPYCNSVNLSGVRVLVVDDEIDARNLIQRVLSDCNAEVYTAGSAGDALQLFETVKPHVLVSDIGMPDVDGYELMKHVRALGPAKGGRIPAIALTAFARSEDRTRALRAGFLVHVAKPVEPSELVATVASVAGRNSESFE